MPDEKRKRSLNIEDENVRLLFYMGAVYSVLSESRHSSARHRQTLDELWQLFPYVKAFVALSRRFPAELKEEWERALREPMPFNGEPLGVPEAPPLGGFGVR